MARLSLVEENSQDPVVAEIFGTVKERLDSVPALYRMLAHAPALLQGWVQMAWPLRHESTTPRALRELVILRVAQLTDAGYEWHAHLPMALRSGVTEAQVEALRRWSRSDGFSSTERAALRLTDELTTTVDISEATFADLRDAFSERQIVELILTAAFYTCVSRVVRGFGLGAEDLPTPPPG
ncbi:MAG TPA: carboxymuconolactone decarboxylase family protein [Candidatus Dormibacteraeota bacterium]